MHQQMPINCHYNQKFGKIMNFLSQLEWLDALKWPKNFNVGFLTFGPKAKQVMRALQ